MSKGFVGHMRLTSDDGEFFICRYGCCNLNIESHKELYYHDESGEIHIARCALYEGNDHFEEYLTTGKIQVKNAQGTWNTTVDGVDTIALHLLLQFFREHRETGKIPMKVIWFV